MKNDSTRDTFHRTKHLSRVLMQQGRVQLDADWNEQVSILHHYLRTLASDLLGSGAGPKGTCGFELIVDQDRLNALAKDLGIIDPKKLPDLAKELIIISPGRYYVNGLLAENERLLSFGENNQPDAVKNIKDTLNPDHPLLLMYLDVWERHITFIEDDEIREKALGGLDTATRAKIEWAIRARPFDSEIKPTSQIKLEPPPKQPALDAWRKDLQPQFEAWSQKQWTNRPRLRAGIKQQSESDDPCVCSPESVYGGLENQLYRVEIHRPGPAWNGTDKSDAVMSSVATFKWSRDNGSVVAAWVADEDDTLKVSGARDQARGFDRGQWVELSDEQHDLEATPGTLVQLKEVEAGSLTFDPTTASGGSVLGHQNFGRNAKVRRWDQKATEETSLNGGAITTEYDKWFDLEDGVQVQFKAPDGKDPGQFRSGDYWLIAARVATHDIEWPWETEAKEARQALLPNGIQHYSAMLGLVAEKAADSTLIFADLRSKFVPLPSA
ncbi:MAG: hypothetical protein DME97_05315 [Verrucomicrobia bacterium]|nr:MAG: hypothetical protein DME97_05315 [Verrucomicrobiota bacterium]